MIATHPDRVVVAAGQQRLPGRGAQGGGVEPGVPQPVAASRSAFGVLHGPPNVLDARSRRRPAT